MSVTKNDQHREGHIAFLGRSGKVTCPVAVTERLVKLLTVAVFLCVPISS